MRDMALPLAVASTVQSLADILRRDVVAAGRALLGCELVRGPLRARIVETESYRSSDDQASHAYRGRTARNDVMFGPPGHAYVYFSYGCHWMLNVVAHPEGDAAAVLIRAAEPLAGLDDMFARRGVTRPEDLLSGPGKLCQAFSITRAENGADLLTSSGDALRLEPGRRPRRILASPRVGISKSVELPWRFVDASRLAWVSKPRPAATRQV